MGRKSLKRQPRMSKNTNFNMNKNSLYVNNISLEQMFQIMDSPESEYSGTILKNILIAGIALNIMSQIVISAIPEKADYVDKLPSYKDMKKKFITDEPGRTLAACSGIAKSFPYLMQDPSMTKDDNLPQNVGNIVIDLVENPSPNSKRIKPSIAEWQKYAKGEMSAGLGQMISCPSTNLKTLNIDGAKIANYGLEDAIASLGISKETLSKYNISSESISDSILSIFLLSNKGIPVPSLYYDEPSSIFSKIQKEILGDKLKRTGNINSSLDKELEPETPITRTQIEKYLSGYELIAYNFAIKGGDKNILKKYIDLIKERSKN
jgi:hypothetical protein